MSVFPELWRLGQAYFAGELFVRTDALKKDEFKVITQFMKKGVRIYSDTYFINNQF